MKNGRMEDALGSFVKGKPLVTVRFLMCPSYRRNHCLKPTAAGRRHRDRSLIIPGVLQDQLKASPPILCHQHDAYPSTFCLGVLTDESRCHNVGCCMKIPSRTSGAELLLPHRGRGRHHRRSLASYCIVFRLGRPYPCAEGK